MASAGCSNILPMPFSIGELGAMSFLSALKSQCSNISSSHVLIVFLLQTSDYQIEFRAPCPTSPVLDYPQQLYPQQLVSISDNETKMERINDFSAEKIKNFSAEKGKLPKIEYFKGVVYEGEVRNKKPHGVGKVTYKDGSVCEGIWKDGKIVYEGQLNEQGEPQGKGTWFYPHGGTYKGGWKNGKKHGKGTTKRSDGSMAYKGGWKNNLQDGDGTRKYRNGNVYTGGFRAGNRHGNGVMTYANGNTYDGQWKNGKEDGEGTMKYHNGDTHEGEFSKGKMHGKGTHTYAAGDLFKSIGEWKEGKKCGKFKNTYRVEVSEHAYYDNDELKSESHLKRERVALNEDTDTEDLPPSKRRNVCISPSKN